MFNLLSSCTLTLWNPKHRSTPSFICCAVLIWSPVMTSYTSMRARTPTGLWSSVCRETRCPIALRAAETPCSWPSVAMPHWGCLVSLLNIKASLTSHMHDSYLSGLALVNELMTATGSVVTRTLLSRVNLMHSIYNSTVVFLVLVVLLILKLASHIFRL